MKQNYLTVLFAFAATILLHGQDKPPVAVDDFMVSISGRWSNLPVTHNDAAFEGHDFIIFTFFQPEHGTCQKMDHSLRYKSDPGFIGNISVRYVIRDVVNQLTDTATVYLEIVQSGVDTLDVNNVRAQFSCYGLNFNEEWQGAFEVPAGSGIHTIRASTLWLTARDQFDSLYTASALFTQGEDFFPGPVMDQGSYSQKTDISWTRNWKITHQQVTDHKSNWQDPVYLTPEVISLWPANGNTSAGQLAEMAPFADLNSNGYYDPELGEYPEIKGDQAIYCIFNDHRYPHTPSSGGKPGVEVHAMYYGLDQPEDAALWNTIFGKLWIINRSQNHYHDFYCAIFNDFDLGFPYDDFCGTDTLLNAVYAYNGDSFDGNHSPSQPGEYGFHPPAQGLMFLNQRLSASLSYDPSAPMPETPVQFEYALKGYWSDGSPLTYGGNGQGGTQIVKHIYPGDPADPQQWTEVSAMNMPHELRSVASAGPFALLPGDTLMLEVAYVWARDDGGTNISSVHLLKERMADVRDWYENMLGVEETISANAEVSVFPNPFAERICFRLNTNQAGRFKLIDVTGKPCISGHFSNGTADIRTDDLQPGLYFLIIEQQQKTSAVKLIRL